MNNENSIDEPYIIHAGYHWSPTMLLLKAMDN
jgi:hypothetical protein